MRPRRVITLLAAIVLVMLGAAVAWFAVSIPNDIRAEALLKQARADLRKQEREKAAEALQTIVRDFPRTDAAATAADTLFRMAAQDRKKAQQQIELLLRQQKSDRARLDAMEKKLTAALAKPPPAVKQAPPPKPAPKKKTTIRRSTRKGR